MIKLIIITAIVIYIGLLIAGVVALKKSYDSLSPSKKNCKCKECKCKIITEV